MTLAAVASAAVLLLVAGSYLLQAALWLFAVALRLTGLLACLVIYFIVTLIPSLSRMARVAFSSGRP
jgi:hypothetical protein